MSAALIPINANRPTVISGDGWTTYISIHDAEYLRMKGIIRRQLIDAHPDKNGGRSYRFLVLSKRYRAFMQRERWYYWKNGELMPPDWKGEKRPPTGWVEGRRGRLLRA